MIVDPMADDPKQPPKADRNAEVPHVAPAANAAGGDSRPSARAQGTDSQVKDKRRRILRDALFSLAVAVLLIFAKEYFDAKTQAGEQLELATYGWLQHRLASLEPDAPFPIAIVDISDLKPQGVAGAQRGEEATPRKPLEDLLSTLLVNQGAYAAGVDVDFSPEQDGRLPITPVDYDFFDFCLKLRADENKKIYLGVYRTILLSREKWLGPEKYQSLAASILAPRREVTRMVNCIAVNEEEKCEGDTLAALLAVEMRKLMAPAETHVAARFPSIFDRVALQRLSKDVAVGLFPVDYSQLKTLLSREHTYPFSEKQKVAGFGDFFRNKIVLLGDANADKSADKFIVPGEHEPIPGVYIHASAIYTLSQAPLFQLSEQGRWIVDLMLAIVVIGTIGAIRWYYAGRATNEFAHDKVEGMLIVVVIVLSIAIGVGFVHLHRVLWTDFVLAIFALLLHPMTERYTKGLSRWLGRALPSYWRRVAFEDAKEEQTP
jgi:hypothetical protein